MDSVSLNTSLFTGSQSISTDSPNLSMRSIGFTNDTDSSRSSTLLHWNFFLAANYISVGNCQRPVETTSTKANKTVGPIHHHHLLTEYLAVRDSLRPVGHSGIDYSPDSMTLPVRTYF
ncbi:hypothetical protein QQF64_031539, partial [Cirrhinus molitorella]